MAEARPPDAGTACSFASKDTSQTLLPERGRFLPKQSKPTSKLAFYFEISRCWYFVKRLNAALQQHRVSARTSVSNPGCSHPCSPRVINVTTKLPCLFTDGLCLVTYDLC